MFFKVFSIFITVVSLISCDSLLNSKQDQIKVSSATSLTYSKYSSSSEYDQMMSAGVLMIQDVSTEMQAEGISLSEVKKFAEQTEGELKIEADALNININAGLSLTSTNSQGKHNLLSAAAGIVLDSAGKFYMDRKESQTKSRKNEVLKKLNLATIRALKKIKTDGNDTSSETHFSGAVTKIVATTARHLSDLGMQESEIAQSTKELTGDIIKIAKGSVIETKEKLVNNILSGVFLGYEGNDKNAVKRAMEISDEYLGTDLDVEREGDFDKITKAIFESTVAIMKKPKSETDTELARVTKKITKVAIGDVGKTPEKITTLFDKILEAYSNTAVPVPESFEEDFTAEKAIDELANSGSITDEQATSYKDQVKKTKEKAKKKRATQNNPAGDPPKVSFGAPSLLIANASSTISYTLTYENAPNPPLVPSDIKVIGESAGCSVSSITNPGTVNPVINVTGCTGNGHVSLTVAAGKSKNARGLQDTGARAQRFQLDNINPTVSFGAPSSPSATVASIVSYTLTYEIAPNPELASADITFNGVSAGCNVASITNPGTINPIVNVTGCTGNGEVTLIVAEGQSSDPAGNLDQGAKSASFTVENNPPSVSFGDPSSSIAKASSTVSYTLTYEIAPNPALVPADISFNGASAGCSVSSITNPETVNPVVNVTGCTGNGDVSLTVAAGKSQNAFGIQDNGANSLSFTVDNIAPSVSIGSPSYVSQGNILFPLAYDFAPSNLLAGDITVNGASCTVTLSNETTLNPSVNISLCSQQADISISVAAGRSIDSAGNLDQGVTTSGQIYYTRHAPMVFVVKTNNSGSGNAKEFKLPLHGNINIYVDWGDNKGKVINKNSVDKNNSDHQKKLSKEYGAENQEYTVKIYGKAHGWSCIDDDYCQKIIRVTQLGQLDWENLSNAFKGASNLTQFTVGTTDTSNVTNMQGMFSGMSALTSLNISSFDTANVTSMSAMFYNMSSLTSLNLSSFDTSSVTTMREMFSGMSLLTSLTLPANFNTANVTSMSGMFSGMSSLTSLDLSSFNTSEVTNMQGMFSGMSALTSLTLPANFNTSNVTSMNGMFSGMNSLTSLDISNFNTAKVTTMEGMFKGMSLLTSLTLPANFNTANVTSMSGMFSGMSLLTSLTLPANFNTANVTSMSGMFSGMSLLTSLTLPANFNTANVTSMNRMFLGMNSLTSLDISNFNTSNVTSMNGMFSGMNSLTSLDISNFNTSNVTSMNGMFSGMSSLTTLNLTGWDTNPLPTSTNWLLDTLAGLNIYCNNPDGGGIGNSGEGAVNGEACAELTSPAVSFAAPSSSHANASSTVSYPLNYDIAPNPALASADITFNGESAGCSVSSITNPETVNPVVNVTGCTGNGNVSISVAAGKSQGLFGSPDLGATSATFTVDNIAPTVSIGLPLNSSFNIAGSVSYPVTYETPPNPALQASDITVNGANTDCSVSINDSWVTVSQCSGNGEISISVAGGKSQDLAGNIDLGAGPSATALVDNVNPTVSFGAPYSGTANAASIVSYTLTYEIAPNPELVPADISFSGASAGCSVSSITNPETVNPVVNVTGCSGNGEVSLTVAEGQSSDLAGNLDQGATSASFTVDNNPPSVSFGDPSSSIVSAASPVSFTLTYEIAPNPALASADISFSGASAGCSVSSITNPGTVNPVINVTGCTGNGEVTLTVAAGKSQNAFGVQDNGANSLSFTVDNQAARVSIGSPTYVSQGSILFPLYYEFAPTNLGISDITVNGASCTVNMSNETTLNPSVNISSCTAPGNISISVAAGTSVDSAGNLDQGATSQQIYFGAPMIFVVKTNNPGESFRLPFVSGYNYNAHVDWGDSSSNTITSFDQIEATHAYTDAGEYTVTIYGQVEAWDMDNANGDNSNNEKLIRVNQLGDLGWKRLTRAFINTPNLTQFTVGVTDTANVTSMDYMFKSMSSLTSLDLSSFNTSNVTYMGSMFHGMSSLTSLNLSGWNTSSVTSMNYMFNGMSALTSLDLSGWNTSSVTNMGYMFYGMSSLTSLNLTGWDTNPLPTSNAWLTGTTADVLNIYCNNPDGGGTGNSGEGTVNGVPCKKAPMIFVVKTNSADESFRLPLPSLWNGDNYDAHVDWGDGISNSVTSGANFINGIDHTYAAAGEYTVTLSGSVPAWSMHNADQNNSNNEKLIKVIQLGDLGWKNLFGAFMNTPNLSEFTVGVTDTSNVTSMNEMFSGASNLTSLDLKSFNTANVRNISQIFYGMSALTSLNLSGWDVSRMININQMFSGMSSLTSLDLSGWNTSTVTTMYKMFSGMSSLTSLDLSSFNTTNVTDMQEMFSGMSSLTSLDLSGWNTSNVTTMYKMFSGMSSLTSLDLSSFNTTNINNMQWMFSGMSSLTSLDLSGWNTSNVTTMYQMFSGMSSLTSLDLSGWNTTNVTDMQEMFSGMSSLTSLNLTGWDTN